MRYLAQPGDDETTRWPGGFDPQEYGEAVVARTFGRIHPATPTIASRTIERRPLRYAFAYRPCFSQMLCSSGRGRVPPVAHAPNRASRLPSVQFLTRFFAQLCLIPQVGL